MGNGISHLTTEQLEEISANTPFKEKDIEKLMKKYSHYDSSDRGVTGIPYQTCTSIPEFCGNKLISNIIQCYMDKNSNKIYPKQFVYICGVLSQNASAKVKKEFLFEMLDKHKVGVLTHSEMFSFYKSVFDDAVSDSVLLDLTFRALNHMELSTSGIVTKEEFLKMIPDNEVVSRLSVDLGLT